MAATNPNTRKGTCQALIAGRRSAAHAAPGAAPATTREDGPNAKPLYGSEGAKTERACAGSTGKNKAAAGFLYHGTKVGSLCSIRHSHLTTNVRIYLFLSCLFVCF